MSTFAVILAAAGKSSRFGEARRKKPFIELEGRPVWVRALEPFMNREDVKQLLVVISPDDVEWFKEKFRPNLAFMNVEVVAGGAERADSVQNALARVKGDVEYVAVHDAARPLLARQWVTDVFSAAEKHGAAILASRVASTVKRVAGDRIEETVPRENLWLAQTPQVFSRKLLIEAYSKRGGFQATDEAQLVERIGAAVHVVECPSINMKITTQDDFTMAQALLHALPKEKGLANLHPFAEDELGWLKKG